MMEPRKPEHANTTANVAGAPGFQIQRFLEQYAYPANGNTHNPTPRYYWFLLLDGRQVDGATRRGTLLSSAREPNARKFYTDGGAHAMIASSRHPSKTRARREVVDHAKQIVLDHGPALALECTGEVVHQSGQGLSEGEVEELVAEVQIQAKRTYRFLGYEPPERWLVHG